MTKTSIIDTCMAGFSKDCPAGLNSLTPLNPAGQGAKYEV